MNRKTKEDKANDGEGTESSKKKGSKKRLATDSPGGLNSEVLESVKRKRDMEEQSLALNKEKFHWEQMKVQQEEDRFLRTHCIQERKIALEESRFELDREELKAEREDR